METEIDIDQVVMTAGECVELLADVHVMMLGNGINLVLSSALLFGMIWMIRAAIRDYKEYQENKKK